jgi:hypothetical protein
MKKLIALAVILGTPLVFASEGENTQSIVPSTEVAPGQSGQGDVEAIRNNPKGDQDGDGILNEDEDTDDDGIPNKDEESSGTLEEGSNRSDWEAGRSSPTQ